MTFSITTKPRLVLTSVKCLVVFAVVCAAGSYEAPAHGWERSKVGSGKIEYRLPELIKDPATARTCLIDGFGKQADAAGDKKDVKVFSQFVSSSKGQAHALGVFRVPDVPLCTSLYQFVCFFMVRSISAETKIHIC